MITLDQVLLLEQKVESAVGKIQQLEAENAALRSKCLELTNALTANAERLSSYETDQNKIESGIRKALDRLNSIENTVLKAASTASEKPVEKVDQVAFNQPAPAVEPVAEEIPQPVVTETPSYTEEPQYEPEETVQEPVIPQEIIPETPANSLYRQSFDSMTEIPAEPAQEISEEYAEADVEEEASDDLGFDIF